MYIPFSSQADQHLNAAPSQKWSPERYRGLLGHVDDAILLGVGGGLCYAKGAFEPLVRHKPDSIGRHNLQCIGRIPPVESPQALLCTESEPRLSSPQADSASVACMPRPLPGSAGSRL